jgi:hypothetical protein
MVAITKNRNFFKWPKLLYLNQKVPKFELYKHNDELFNMYYRIFYELRTALRDTILKGDHPRIISAKFG